jgi:hypothetical protein
VVVAEVSGEEEAVEAAAEADISPIALWWGFICYTAWA